MIIHQEAYFLRRSVRERQRYISFFFQHSHQVEKCDSVQEQHELL